MTILTIHNSVVYLNTEGVISSTAPGILPPIPDSMSCMNEFLNNPLWVLWYLTLCSYMPIITAACQSVSVMKVTLLVLLLSVVAMTVTCDLQLSERGVGPGCPLGKRLAFDLNTTLEESKRLNNEYFDCPNPEPGGPCFYYSHEGNKQFKAGDVVKVGSTLRSCFLQLYCIIFRIVQNPMLDHFIVLVVLFDTSPLMAQTFQGVTVRTSWCLSAVHSGLLVFYVTEAVFKIMVRGRTYFRNPWNDLDFFIVFMSLLDFTLSLVQSTGGFGSRQASTLFQVLKTLKGAQVFRTLRLLKAIRFFKGLQAILLTHLQSFWSMSSIIVLMFLFLFIFAVIFREMFNESDPEHFGNIFRTIFTLFQILTLDDWSLIYMTSRDNGAPHIIYFLCLYIFVELFTFLNFFIAVLVDNFQLIIRKKRQCKSQKSPDVNEGETQSSEKVVEDLEMSQAEIEEELHKKALRHASSGSKHSKRMIELIYRHLQLLAAMDQHMQKYRSQACLLDNLVETFFTVRSFSMYMP
ncbi:hypothetical protein AOLI_G00194870 [Acnodon oligacanthus]